MSKIKRIEVKNFKAISDQVADFDASFLDRNSLKEVQEWADENDLQLLIERPDFDCGEIKFEIL